jgi:hypothetical protein
MRFTLLTPVLNNPHQRRIAAGGILLRPGARREDDFADVIALQQQFRHDDACRTKMPA